MKTWRRTSTVAIVVLLGMISTSAFLKAQDTEYLPGRPTSATTVPVERGFINLADGNLHLEIPLGSFKGRGALSTNLRMVYDSMIWHGVTTVSGSKQWQPTNIPNSMGGWRFVSSSPANFSSGESTTSICGTGYDSAIQYGPFYFGDLQGTSHTFPFITIENPSPESGCTDPQYADTPTGSGYAIDGSGYYGVVTNYNELTIYDRTGAQVWANGVDKQTDSNGNYNDDTGDDLGRVLVPSVTTSPDGNTTYYNVLTTYGSTEQYSVTTETIQLHTHFLSDSVGSDFQGTMTVVQSIGLPDGSSYSFTYEEGNYGELSSVTLPHGGTVSYLYQSGLNGTRSGEAVPPRWVSSHTGSNGTTTFSIIPSNCPGGIGQLGPCPVQHNYLTRNGSTTDYHFSLQGNSGYFNDFVYYHTGDQNSGVVRTVAKTYHFDTPCPATICGSAGGYLWPNLATVAEVFNDSLMTKYTSYDYSTPAAGIPTTVKQWDYYTSSPSSTPPYAPSGSPRPRDRYDPRIQCKRGTSAHRGHGLRFFRSTRANNARL